MILPLCTLAMAFAIVGCDPEENEEAGAAAGEAVEKTVETVGEGTREAADSVGGVLQDAGDALEDAADDEDNVEEPGVE